MRLQAVRVFVPLSIVRSLGQSVTRELQVGGWRVVPANLAPSLFYVEERRLGLSERRAEASLLLEHGADPNLCMNDGTSPLICAAMAPGDAGLGAAALLLDAKADIDHPQEVGQTALQAACECSNVEVAKLLLERGANINLQKSEGMAALHIALQFSYVEIAKLLLERGADKDLRDNDGDGVDYYVNAAEHSQEELRALLARY